MSLIRSKRMMKGENIWEMKRRRRIKKNMWEDEKKSDGDKEVRWRERKREGVNERGSMREGGSEVDE